MNTIRPFEVGTTVKWCNDGRECAGIVTEVCTDRNFSEGAADGDPRYLIRLTDRSEISKSHSELVVV